MTPHPAYHPPSLLHQSEAVQAISAEMAEEMKKKKKDYGLLKALKAKRYAQIAYETEIARLANIQEAAEVVENFDLAEEIADELEKMENTTPEEHAAQVSTRVYTYPCTTFLSNVFRIPYRRRRPLADSDGWLVGVLGVGCWVLSTATTTTITGTTIRRVLNS